MNHLHLRPWKQALGLIALATLLAVPTFAQDPAPETPDDKPAPKLPTGFKPKAQDPFASLRPGILPADTSAEARAAFARLAPRDTKGAVLAQALHAFDLDFEIVARGEGPQNNQAKVTVRFAEPAFVAFSVGKDKQMGFGPKGYWQAFPDGTRLLEGRDYVSDRRRIGEVRSVAKNFLSLADPRRLRVTRVWLPEELPKHVPAAAEKALDGLEWLAIDSPDFDVAIGQTAGEVQRTARLYRAWLGVEPEAGVVREALLQELREVEREDGSKALVLVPGTTMWVRLSERMAVGATTLPGVVHVYLPDPKDELRHFEARPREELYLLRGKLNPKLDPVTFDPPGLK